jgi:SAM-dependent methyltransferase
MTADARQLDVHRAANRANWDARVPIHVASRTYDVVRYRTDPAHVSGVVAADAPHLGDLTGLRIAHVQCHIGTDTLSLARLGAAEVVGIDFSPASLAAAEELARDAAGGDRVRFEESSVDEIPALELGAFDLVYATVGVLCWHPSVADWTRTVTTLLGPGGRLYLRDGHPALQALDDEARDPALVTRYPYFETPEPLRWDEHVTYTDGDTEVTAPTTYQWNHGLAEIVQSVLDAGLTLTRLAEGRTLDWAFVPWMVDLGDGSGRTRWPDELVELLPLEFTLEAVRPGR